MDNFKIWSDFPHQEDVEKLTPRARKELNQVLREIGFGYERDEQGNLGKQLITTDKAVAQYGLRQLFSKIQWVEDRQEEEKRSGKHRVRNWAAVMYTELQRGLCDETLDTILNNNGRNKRAEALSA